MSDDDQREFPLRRRRTRVRRSPLRDWFRPW